MSFSALTPAMIEQEANMLTSFNGGFSNYAEEDYFGYDDSLDFDANESDFLGFAAEGMEPRQWSFTVDSNETANVCRFFIVSGTKSFVNTVVELPVYGALASGAYPVTGKTRVLMPKAPNGLLFDGQFVDKDGLVTSWDSTHGLTGSSAGVGTIGEMQSYIQENPTRLRKIKIVSTDINQLQYDLVVRKISPFKTLAERRLHPANNQDQYVNQTSIVVFDVNEVLDANTQIEYAIAPASTATITLYFGASSNQGKALQNKGNRTMVRQAAAGGNKGAIIAAAQRKLGR